MVHADHHPPIVDISNLQVDGLRHTQASVICNRQDGTLLQAGNRLEETRDIIEA